MADNRSQEQIAFDDLVSDLIQNTDASDFNGALLQGLEHQTPDFWKYLIDYMYHEYEQQYLGHSPIRESDFSGDPSFVEFLNTYVDLDNDQNRTITWSTIWRTIKENALDDETSTWNESINKIIKQFVNAFDAEGKIYIKGSAEEENSIYISIYDIIHANAGNKFTGSEDTNKWVLPNINVDNETYGEVRGKDKILSVLNNEEDLQFTNSSVSNEIFWLRLLMPKYLRKVEVEDLNRNFWVLGQTMSAVCAFLFGPEAPFAKLFEDMAAEITQLWENVLYLWLAYAMSTQQQEVTNVYSEVVYLPNSVYEPYIKFDNFDRATITFDNNFWTEVENKCSYIINQHLDSNVVIIPKIRWKNFKHNYYETEVFPGIVWFNKNTEEISHSTFRTYIEQNDNWVVEEEGIFIDAASNSHYSLCWAVKEDEFNYTLLPSDYVLSHSEYENDPYYTLLRVNPSFGFSYNTTTKKLNVNVFSIKTQDIGTLFFCAQNDDSIIDTYRPDAASDETQEYIDVKHYIKGSREAIPSSPELPYEVTIKSVAEANKGAYYQGEFPSWLVAWGINQ